MALKVSWPSCIVQQGLVERLFADVELELLIPAQHPHFLGRHGAGETFEDNLSRRRAVEVFHERVEQALDMPGTYRGRRSAANLN